MRTLLLKAMVVVAIAGVPAFASAQQTDADVQRTVDAADREDRGEWGWLGLLGLGGLLGLLRRRDPIDHMSTRERPTPAR